MEKLTCPLAHPLSQELREMLRVRMEKFSINSEESATKNMLTQWNLEECESMAALQKSDQNIFDQQYDSAIQNTYDNTYIDSVEYKQLCKLLALRIDEREHFFDRYVRNSVNVGRIKYETALKYASSYNVNSCDFKDLARKYGNRFTILIRNDAAAFVRMCKYYISLMSLPNNIQSRAYLREKVMQIRRIVVAGSPPQFFYFNPDNSQRAKYKFELWLEPREDPAETIQEWIDMLPI